MLFRNYHDKNKFVTNINPNDFKTGIEADIKLVICEDDTPYTEGVLFHNGCELTCTEPDCTYDGEWNFEYDGTKYTVLIEVEN